jgi:hypothetical protein
MFLFFPILLGKYSRCSPIDKFLLRTPSSLAQAITISREIGVLQGYLVCPVLFELAHRLTQTSTVCSRTNPDIFLGVIHFVKGHKYPKLILDNNEFIVHQKGSSRTRWRCAQCNKTKCKAALFTTGKVVRVYYEHNHPRTMENRYFESLFSQNVTIIKHTH